MSVVNNLTSILVGGMTFFALQAPSVAPTPQIPSWVIEVIKAAAALLLTFVFHQIQKRYSKRLQKNEAALVKVAQVAEVAKTAQDSTSNELTILKGQLTLLSQGLDDMKEDRDAARQRNETYEQERSDLLSRLEETSADRQRLNALLEASNRGMSSLSIHLDEQDRQVNDLQLQLAEHRGAAALADSIVKALDERFPIEKVQQLVTTIEQIRGYAETLNIKASRRTQEIKAISMEENPSES